MITYMLSLVSIYLLLSLFFLCVIPEVLPSRHHDEGDLVAVVLQTRY